MHIRRLEKTKNKTTLSYDNLSTLLIVSKAKAGIRFDGLSRSTYLHDALQIFMTIRLLRLKVF